jgi:trk system potassium uptake protein TrkA
VPVLDDDRKVRGTIATSDIVRGYRLGLLASLRQLDGDGQAAGTRDVEVTAGSRLIGVRLRDAALPEDVIITTIQRGRDLVVPNGDTVLQAGDHLVLMTRSGERPV